MPHPISRPPAALPWRLAGVVLLGVACLAVPEALEGSAGLAARGATFLQEPTRHDVTISSRKYAFSPARIEVMQGDVVRVTLTAEDIPHSFTIDEYRIAKRAAPGHPITFEFRADRPGTFTFYCNLTIDDGCREMRGELVVVAR